MNQAELQLVQAAQRGDRNAFGALVERHRGRVFALARAVTNDPQEAQELTQETFTRALQNLPRLETPERFTPWLSGITYNLSQDLRRRAARERKALSAAAQGRPATSPGAGQVFADQTALSERQRRLAELVATLPENTRVALDLRFREGLSYAQIGEVMGVPPSTVRGLLYRGTKALREQLR